jgi:hypothetical protein
MNSKPDAAMIAWYAEHKQRRRDACNGSDRSHYWNLNADQKREFIAQLCRQYGVREPQLAFDPKHIRKHEHDGRGVIYSEGRLYCMPQATYGKNMLWAFYQHYWFTLYRTNPSQMRPEGDYMDPAEVFADEFWSALREAVAS